MARGIPIDGEKLAEVWRKSLLPQEEFAALVGYGRSGLGRLLRPGVRDMHTKKFRKLAEYLKLEPDELLKRIGGVRGKESPTAAQSAVSRLLGGQAALVTELQAAAVAEGITLPELFQRISRLWLDERRPPKVAHTQLDGLKPRTPPAPRSAGEGSSRGESAPGPRPARRAGRNGR